MSTFTFLPSYGIQLTKQMRTKRAQFGDGYMQRTVDGINNQPRRWQLTFEKPASEIASIDSFLSDLNGVDSFDWTPETGDAGKWICEEWRITEQSFEWQTLSATFEEVFGE